MNCEWIEEHLSAYHDHALDAKITEQVGKHVVRCTHCTEILADYARFDHMLTVMPRYAPAAALHDRIFQSSEFREILQGNKTSDVPTPLATKLPPPSRLHPHTMRVAVQVLALVVLLSGATFAISQILASRGNGLPFGACPTALSSGTRLVYRTDNTLMSGTEKLICNPNTRVAPNWQVSPNGQWIAYVDSTTHTLRLVRADTTHDHQVDADAANIVALSWSPDSQTLLIVKMSGQMMTLWRADTETSQATLLNTVGNGHLEQGPAWSADGHSIALGMAATDGKTNPIVILGLQNSITQESPLTSQGDARAITMDTPIVALGWTNGTDPTLTWAIRDPLTPDLLLQSTKRSVLIGSNGGFYGLSLLRPHIAEFSATSGKWAIATAAGEVASVDAATFHQTPLAQIGTVTSLQWSPDGSTLAVTSANTLWLVSPSGATKIGTHLGNVPPAWNADGSTLAFQQNNAVEMYTLATGKTTAASSTGAGSVAGLLWSPDAHMLAIWGSTGITLVHSDGSPDGTLSGALSDVPQWTVVG